MSGITITWSPEEVELIRDAAESPDTPAFQGNGKGRLAINIRNKAAAALATHEREEKRKALGLPLKPLSYPGGGFAIYFSGFTDQRMGTEVSFPNEAIRDFFLHTPDLAEALEEALNFFDPEGSAHEEQRALAERWRALLSKARWL